ncbi:Aldo/keto reductase [Xylariaceae sp. FL0255]|nr:Aldo/keto reductase [Xylariaceae sp. FL0255]
MAQQTGDVKVVFMTVTLGKAARVPNLDDAREILDAFQRHGYNELDTARGYAGGTTGEYFAELKWTERGLVLATKRPIARFGISNFPSWQVSQNYEICACNGWKRPDVCQGLHSGLQRSVELESLPCLCHYGINFYARFDTACIIRPIAAKLGITTAEAALRWVRYHSNLSGKCGDAAIVGATSAQQLEDNLTTLVIGPLPEKMVKAFESGWAVKPYFRTLPKKPA